VPEANTGMSLRDSIASLFGWIIGLSRSFIIYCSDALLATAAQVIDQDLTDPVYWAEIVG
jgi:hypothetical protein